MSIPRFTRTSAMADIWVPLRAGTDILFLGGLIHYALENNKYFREYVQHYTNAPTILREISATPKTWAASSPAGTSRRRSTIRRPGSTKARSQGRTRWRAPAGHSEAGGGHGKDRGGEAGKTSEHETDPTLQHPRCVFQVLQAALRPLHAGTGRATCRRAARSCFSKVAEAFCNASGPDKTAAICYAVGWTQHSKGVQIIRSAAILQLLLGNIGRPGGGILALRGHASIQGSTDIPTLYDILPGYLPMPFFEEDANDSQELHQEAHGRRRAVVQLRQATSSA